MHLGTGNKIGKISKLSEALSHAQSTVCAGNKGLADTWSGRKPSEVELESWVR